RQLLGQAFYSSNRLGCKTTQALEGRNPLDVSRTLPCQENLAESSGVYVPTISNLGGHTNALRALDGTNHNHLASIQNSEINRLLTVLDQTLHKLVANLNGPLDRVIRITRNVELGAEPVFETVGTLRVAAYFERPHHAEHSRLRELQSDRNLCLGGAARDIPE